MTGAFTGHLVGQMRAISLAIAAAPSGSELHSSKQSAHRRVSAVERPCTSGPFWTLGVTMDHRLAVHRNNQQSNSSKAEIHKNFGIRKKVHLPNPLFEVHVKFEACSLGEDIRSETGGIFENQGSRGEHLALEAMVSFNNPMVCEDVHHGRSDLSFMNKLKVYCKSPVNDNSLSIRNSSTKR